MQTTRLILALALALGALVPCVAPAADASGKVRVLIVTGGHDYEKDPFFEVFRGQPDISYIDVEHPKAYDLFKPEASAKYDVILLYDMYQGLTDEAKANFLALLKEGKGLLVMHHAIANYQKWPEYAKIIGARYYLEPTTVDGVEKKRSTYKHDVVFKIQVADPKHPVTAGMKDFEIHDETYKGFDVAPDVHALLTTDHPDSNKIISWAKTYDNSRVVYLQLGHDHFAYENPAFRQVVRQVIRWVARKEPAP